MWMKTILSAIAILISIFSISAQEDCSYELVCPPDIMLSCTDDLAPENSGTPEVISDCSTEGLDLVWNDVSEGDECLSIISRTFELYNGDVLLASCSQSLSVIDDVPPYFPNLPEDLVIECGAELPEAPECPAVDDCSGVVECDIFEVQTGSPVDSCLLTLADGPGPDWAVWLPSLPIEDPHFVWDGDAHMVTYFNGTAHITGLVRNSSDPSLAYEVDMWLESARNWDEWSALGRYYKDDYNLVDEEYLDWTYYEMVNVFSRLIGTDALEGSELELYHMPSDFFFGFQSGVGANNQNLEEGISGWFTFEGEFQGEYIEGHGDLSTDKSCTPIENNGGGDCNSGGYTVYWHATDACGNSATASQSVDSQDNEAPEFVDFPADIEVNCSELPFETEAPIAVDSCPGEVTVEGPVDEIIEAECPVAYYIERTWTAIDVCGNATSQSQLIAVLDDEAPMFTDVPEVVELVCASELEMIYAEATDSCTDVEISFTDEPLDGEGLCAGSALRTYTATDACGNTVTATQEILVNDDEAPVFTSFPENMVVSCDELDGVMEPIVEFSDNCPDVAMDVQEEFIPGSCEFSYTLVRTFVLSDACGNTTSADWTLEVMDETAPELLGVPADATLTCEDEIPDAIVFATDNCDPSPIVSLTATTEELDCGQIFVRTWTAVDACGNSTSLSQTITFIDETGPIFISFPEDLSLSCDQQIPAAEVEAEDTCSDLDGIEMTEEIIEGDCDASYTVVRTYTATDACGNSTSQSQTITVTDDQAPVFDEYPMEVSVSCDEINSFNYEVSADDNCGVSFLSYSDSSDDYSCGNEIIRTWTSTDECGNASSVEQIILVIDEEAPVVLSFPEDMTIACEDYDPEMEISYEVTDNCVSDLTLEVEDNVIEGDCPNSFVHEITYTWFDGCGNGTSRTLTITVQDTEAPVLLGVPDDVTIGCLDPVPDAIVFATDNCAAELEVSLTATTEELECGELFIRTWSTVDECGNEVSATQTITIIDDTDPYLSFFPEDIYLTCGDPLPEPADVEVFDDCDDDPILVIIDEVNGTECPYTVTRVYRGADCNGNYTIYAQTIFFEEGKGGPGIAPVPTFDVNVYANGYDLFGIDISSSKNSRAKVEILNLNGQQIDFISELSLEADKTSKLIYNSSVLAPGIYLVQVSTAEYRVTRKISVVR